MAFRIALNQPNKASAKAKAKAEAEAKDRQDAEEYNRVLADVRDEHGNDDNATTFQGRDDEEPASEIVVPTGSARHFAGRARTGKSGPGTLEPEPSFGFNTGRFGGQSQSGYSDPVQQTPSSREKSKVFASIVGIASELPLDTDQAIFEPLFADYPSLKIEKIEKAPPSGPSTRGRPSTAMLITFDKDASQVEFNNAVLALNDKKYLGRGYYLHFDRYYGSNSAGNPEDEPLPFGATRKAPEVPKGFAPPPDLRDGAFGGLGERLRQEEERLVVKVEQPSDLATLKLIHQTIEGVIQGGQEFEAALMQDPRVMADEKFVWLYNSDHPCSIYYRWRLHRTISDMPRPNIFRGEATWVEPEMSLPDEYASHLEDLDPEFDVPESEEDEEKPQRGLAESTPRMLSPGDRTYLIWLLAGLPPSSLQFDDIAPVTTFAVDHVNDGMGEIVDLLITNIIVPFSLTEAKANYRSSKQDVDEYRKKMAKTTSNALRIVSDLALATHNDRRLTNTWKCRQSISQGLIERKVFEYLDTVPQQLGLGKFSESTFRDEINAVLKVWQKETVFDNKTYDIFEKAFNERERIKKQDKEQANRRKAPRKTVKVPVKSSGDMEADQGEDVVMGNMDGAAEYPSSPEEAVDTVEVEKPSESVRTYPEPKEYPRQEVVTEPAPAAVPAPAEIPGETAAARARRMRPKAEDMFASDED